MTKFAVVGKFINIIDWHQWMRVCVYDAFGIGIENMGLNIQLFVLHNQQNPLRYALSIKFNE